MVVLSSILGGCVIVALMARGAYGFYQDYTNLVNKGDKGNG